MRRYCVLSERVWNYLMPCLLLATTSRISCGEDFSWIREIGTLSQETNAHVAAEAFGNVFVLGSTRGSVGGTTAGDWDVFLCKFSAAGDSIWTRQQGTSGVDVSAEIAADGLGGAYIVGESKGDAFVSRYDSAGNLLWHRLISSVAGEVGLGVSVDHLGNVYVSGDTSGSLAGANLGRSDVFVSKFSQTGDLLWTKQFGTSSSDFNGGVAADGLGNIYVAGSTAGALEVTNSGSFDAFIRKLDADGNVQWTRQYGTVEEDSIRAISADKLGNVFVGGNTFGSLASPYAGTESDVHISKFNAEGNREWSRQFGTTTLEQLYDLSSDGMGNVLFSGQTRGSLFEVNAGGGDMFFGSVDQNGNFLSQRQIGTSRSEFATGVSTDGNGNVYLSGLLSAPGRSDSDVFIAKIPEPRTSGILLAGMLILITARSVRYPHTSADCDFGWGC